MRVIGKADSPMEPNITKKKYPKKDIKAIIKISNFNLTTIFPYDIV